MNTIQTAVPSLGVESSLVRPQGGAATTAGPAAGQDEGGGFTQLLGEAVQRVDGLQAQADQQVAELLQGRGGDLHGALIAVEKADLSFQLMMQVRNKIVSAYEEIARMQF